MGWIQKTFNLDNGIPHICLDVRNGFARNSATQAERPLRARAHRQNDVGTKGVGNGLEVPALGGTGTCGSPWSAPAHLKTFDQLTQDQNVRVRSHSSPAWTLQRQTHSVPCFAEDDAWSTCWMKGALIFVYIQTTSAPSMGSPVYYRAVKLLLGKRSLNLLHHAHLRTNHFSRQRNATRNGRSKAVRLRTPGKPWLNARPSTVTGRLRTSINYI
ncbi:MAG: hypothetical protein Q9222_002197 [Ikaeria aurantiellina]